MVDKINEIEEVESFNYLGVWFDRWMRGFPKDG